MLRLGYYGPLTSVASQIAIPFDYSLQVDAPVWCYDP